MSSTLFDVSVKIENIKPESNEGTDLETTTEKNYTLAQEMLQLETTVCLRQNDTCNSKIDSLNTKIDPDLGIHSELDVKEEWLTDDLLDSYVNYRYPFDDNDMGLHSEVDIKFERSEEIKEEPLDLYYDAIHGDDLLQSIKLDLKTNETTETYSKLEDISADIDLSTPYI
ncbi:hypothetical protein O0L34_g16106 [Tuta absoluta]|nr:hypothetical protein O0L34_g16106 [Tuta absoluta]